MSDLFDRAQIEGTPLIEEGEATFLWRGKEPPLLIADFTDWEGSPIELTRAGEDTWIHRQQLPDDAYIEYAYKDVESNERQADPFNQRSIPNGMGEENHFFHMPGAEPSTLTRRGRGVPKGEIQRYLVPTGDLAAGKERRIYLYRPAEQGPYPLLVVLDGNDYLGPGKLPQILDNLIAQGRVGPVALVLVAHGGQKRAVEYLCSEATVGFLYEKVLPLARHELDLVDAGNNPGAHGILGASLGGLMAMYAGMRLPHIFGRVLSQSGVFIFDEQESVVMELVRYLPPQPIIVWMDVGKFENLLPENQLMYDLLVKRGYQVQYREYPGGHNYTSWRNDLPIGLESLFPPG